MLFIQLTGLSGAGKSSIAKSVQSLLEADQPGLVVKVIDSDEYRKTVHKELGFSKEDRIENIRRLGKIAEGFIEKGFITIVAAINPYSVARSELKYLYGAKIVWINCPLNELIKRDTKGLYQRALTHDNSVEKINNLTGINDPYEAPADADLIINTATEDLPASATRLKNFIVDQLRRQS